MDGASRGYGNSADGLGDGVAGCMIYEDNKLRGQLSKAFGRATNDQAEYEAVHMGLLVAWSSGMVNPRIYSDSQRVVNQVNKEWKCEPDSVLYPLYHSVSSIQEQYSFTLVKVGRRAVQHVDAMIKRTLDAIELERETDVR